MSASRPGSVMLRAATAASGGTGAPDWTYCSIWPWTVRISAWTSRPSGLLSSSSSTSATMYGLRLDEAVQAEALLALDDGAHGAVLELDDLGDLGQGADGVQLGRVGDVLLLGLALGHEGDRRVVGDGLVERLDRLVAADLEGHDHLREDDRLAQGDEGQRLPGGCRGQALPRRVFGSFGLVVIRLSCWVSRAFAVGRLRLAVRVGRVVRRGRPGLREERLQDARAQALLDLEEDRGHRPG